MSIIRCQSCDAKYDTDKTLECPACGDDAPLACPMCGAFTDSVGYSIDERACFYCRAD